jgi:DNA-directed RNA polymerase specialized sigma24 family protein
MKHYTDTDPSNLYRDCYNYVVNRVKGRCFSLRYKEVEDCVSQAFLELYERKCLTLKNWLWLSYRRGYTLYDRYRQRYELHSTLPDVRSYLLEYIETYNPVNVIKRMRSKKIVEMALDGYDYEIIAKEFDYPQHNVGALMYRARILIEKDLLNDVKCYHNGQYQRRASFHQLRNGHSQKRIEQRKQQAIRRQQRNEQN